jgi:cytochrome c biogenesis protein CcmG, thiol:disulfide interchange protein DsbE
MPQTRPQWIVLTVVIALLGALWIGMTRVQASALNTNGRPPSPQPGYSAPDFTLNSIDGAPVTLSDLRGKVVVLNFWATWCPPCRAEIPALEDLSRKYDGKAVVLAVNVQEDPAVVLGFVREYGMTYPVVLDPRAEIARAYQVIAFPTTFFIDARGVIVEVESGSASDAYLQTRLQELTGE